MPFSWSKIGYGLGNHKQCTKDTKLQLEPHYNYRGIFMFRGNEGSKLKEHALESMSSNNHWPSTSDLYVFSFMACLWHGLIINNSYHTKPSPLIKLAPWFNTDQCDKLLSLNIWPFVFKFCFNKNRGRNWPVAYYNPPCFLVECNNV